MSNFNDKFNQKFNTEIGTEKNVGISIGAGIAAIVVALISIFVGMSLEYAAILLWILAAYQATKGKNSMASNLQKRLSYLLVILNVPILGYIVVSTFLETIKIGG